MGASRKPFIGLTLAAVAGILAGGWLPLWAALTIMATAGGAFAFTRHPAGVFVVIGSGFAILIQIQTAWPQARAFAAYAGEHRPVVHGIAQVVDDQRSEGSRRLVRIRELAHRGRPLPANFEARMWWRTGAAPRYGTEFEFIGSATNIEAARNPGQFDLAQLMRTRGVFSEVTVAGPADWEVIAEGRGNPLFNLALQCRDYLQRALDAGLEDYPETAAILKAMTLGIRTDLDREMRHLFVLTGTLHLFAVSGLHVGIVAVLFWFIIRPLGFRQQINVAVVILILIFYCLVTGMRPSTLRATVMASIVLAALFVNRPSAIPNNLAAAAFIILIWNPSQLFHAGFQLSFGVVTAILLLQPLVAKMALPTVLPDPFIPKRLLTPFQRFQEKTGFYGVNLFSVSLAAWIGSVPFILTYFHLFTPVAVLANLVVVPMAFLVLALGFLAMGAFALSATLAALFNKANWLVVVFMVAFLDLAAQIPGGHWIFSRAMFEPETNRVTVLDLGTGGAVVIEPAGGEPWIIDAGNRGHAEWIVAPYLRSRAISTLGGLVLSHGSSTHAGGMPVLMEQFEVGEFVESTVSDRSATRRQAKHTAIELGLPLLQLQRGDRLQLGPTSTLQVLYPPADIQRRLARDKALVLLLEMEGWRILLMSDSGFATEKWLMEHELDLQTDVLIKGRHPTDLCGLPEFIARANPELLVAGGTDRVEGREIPDDWAGAIKADGVALFRQDHCGAVTLKVRPEELRASGYLDQNTLTLRKR